MNPTIYIGNTQPQFRSFTLPHSPPHHRHHTTAASPAGVPSCGQPYQILWKDAPTGVSKVTQKKPESKRKVIGPMDERTRKRVASYFLEAAIGFTE